MRRSSIATLTALGALTLAHPLTAAVVPQTEPLHALVVAPAGFVATPAPRPLALLEGELPAATLGDVAAFRAAAGAGWNVWFDRRSGAVSLVEGQGLPWTEGGTTAAALEAEARALMVAYPHLFQVAEAQLVLDAGNTRRFGDRGQFWNVAFRQAIDGVLVEGATVVFRVAHGNLVQFGVHRAIPATSAVAGTLPELTAGRPRPVSPPSSAVCCRGTSSSRTARSPGCSAARPTRWATPVGDGWRSALVYRFLFTRADSLATWLALVDAFDGQVLRFVDANDYVSVLRASALTEHNCANPADCVPGTAAELPVTLPNARLTFVGGTCAGAGCYTNSAGAFTYPPGAVAAATSLAGRHFNVVDLCGPVLATAVAPANPDLGTSDPLAHVNTDCFPAHRESAPGAGPMLGGPGDTHSARTMYYHLDLINQKSRHYLPHNDWLQGVDGGAAVPTVATNLPPACNAFWAGGQNLFVFMRQTPGLGCNNTGEVPAVGLHEFGHGLDQHDGTGTAPESATGEAMGDTFALLQGQKACFGAGFRLPLPTNPNWGHTAGYGDSTTGSKSRLCTGVRELDYTRLCSAGDSATPDCVAPRDPDAPNGSRSGLAPPADPSDAGTPARWNHMIADAPEGVADGRSNFYDCGGPETTGCAGPLSHGCHCESSIPSQANWDLAKQLIADRFGGDAYADPPGPTEIAGWQTMDRLWYLTRDLAVSGYSVTGPFPEGTTNGCSVTDWFATYRFIDDDDGDLADGTPHADILFAAFDLHGIACGAAADPANQGAGCPAPLAAPAAGTCGGDAPVQLGWSPVAGASEFRVLRNTLGCGFGFTPVGTVGGSRTTFEDAEVAPGVTYYYSVQPVGANASCYGHVSDCVTVTPAACSSAPPPASPAAVDLADAGANAIQVSWQAAPGAGSYKVLRKEGDCSSSAPEQAVGTVTAPGTAFVDRDGIVGGQTYAYRVAAAAGACASCAGDASACRSIVATGACAVPPLFAGVAAVASATDGPCRLDVAWDPATPACGGATVTYDVYRGTDPGFTPTPANRIAAGLAATGYVDLAVSSGTGYTYVVRAVDSHGNADGNLVRRTEAPAGQLVPGTFHDDAGDTVAVKFRGTWAVRDSGPGNATRQYATSASGNYPSNACLALESDTVYLGADPALAFRSRFDTEPGWDGGIVEVATAAGGFTDWSKLGTIDYPGLMTSPDTDPACGGPGFADGQPVFTGISPLDGWSDHSGSLAAYAGQAVRIRFLFGSDASSERGGWFVDDLRVTGAELPSPCRPCREVDDADAAVERYGFLHQADPAASNGGYHYRMGTTAQDPPFVRLFFHAESVTYRYGTSEKGGTADVYVDGELRETVSLAGTTTAVVFGATKTYAGLGPGFHEIRVVPRTQTTYVDGFDLDCAGEADASAVGFTTETTTSTAALNLPVVLLPVQVGAKDRRLTVRVAGGAGPPPAVRLRSPLGALLATGGALLQGFNDTGLDAAATRPGTYLVEVLRPPGLTGGTVEVSVARTIAVRSVATGDSWVARVIPLPTFSPASEKEEEGCFLGSDQQLPVPSVSSHARLTPMVINCHLPPK